MNRYELRFVFIGIFIWILFLIIVIYFSKFLWPLQQNFLGGGINNYINNPYVWAFSNFDGEHYLAIAREGYKPLTYFFFPLYPILINIFHNLLGNLYQSYLTSGILISIASLIFAIVGLYKLIRLDFKQDMALIALILLISFPTAYYLISVYTESLFLALTVWSFYFVRQKRYFLAALLGGLSGITRIIGVFIFIPLLWEYLKLKHKDYKSLFLLIIPAFLLIYIIYIWYKTGDPLTIINSVSIFGAQRSGQLILLPQVFYRYVFKILPNINYNYFPGLFTAVLELTTGLVFTLLTIVTFIKLRLSYALLFLYSFIIPTFSGSFSSLPRYVLIIFPVYILAATLLRKRMILLFCNYINFIYTSNCLF